MGLLEVPGIMPSTIAGFFSLDSLLRCPSFNRVARELNERPRETLELETPAKRFNQCVASTG